MGSLWCPFVGGNLMEVVTLVADGAVSWISVTVEILDTQAHTHTPSNSHIPHPFKFLHQIYSTMEAEGSNWKVFICLGPQAPRVHIFPVLFFCLLLVSCRACVCFSQAPVSSVFFFLPARLQDSHSPLVDLQGAGAAGWQIWCKVVEERSWWKINWCSAFANSSVYVCVCVCGRRCMLKWGLATCGWLSWGLSGWSRWQ